uniref:Uncharacterized protein n=1 Tax=Setaria italica TaxID=4555 RepID=K3ZKW0_SETIT
MNKCAASGLASRQNRGAGPEQRSGAQQRLQSNGEMSKLAYSCNQVQAATITIKSRTSFHSNN